MILKTINCSTGPVAVTDEVKQAFCQPPVSHRSKAFRELFDETTGVLCSHFNVNKAYLLTGSGTLANETMLWQIRQLDSRGLILSNGEFGERLIAQAERIGIGHKAYQLSWGKAINVQAVSDLIKENDLKWILLCHCETSTGIINPLEEIIAMAEAKDVQVFADCTSTVGTRIIDLSKVAAATCSSGKGLGCFPGLAIVLSNLAPCTSKELPVYADLMNYDRCEGVPFTISSNMVEALNSSIKQKLQKEQYDLVEEFSAKLECVLTAAGLRTFTGPRSAVCTFPIPHPVFIKQLNTSGLTVSYESSYLKKRNWGQVAFFGHYTKEELTTALNIFELALENVGELNLVAAAK